MHLRDSDTSEKKIRKRVRLSDVPRHSANPLSIRPLGNLLLPDAQPNGRLPGLGALNRLPDDLVTTIFAQLDASDWLRAQGTSRAFLAWCSIEGLWKVEYLRATEGYLRAWHGLWRDTYIVDVCRQLPHHTATAAGIASDVLYQPILCALHHAESLFASVRGAKGTIERIDARDLASSAELPRAPVILTHAIDDWPACKRWTSIEHMCQRVGSDALFRAEAALVTLPTYARYANFSHDDSPLYLFHAAPLPSPLAEDIGQPRVFDEDLFAALGEKMRPDHQWLIIGPERAGSTFHQDPNGTSAWNAVVAGAKAWICFHPSVTPPGVRVSEDMSEVETPLSVTEWLISYLAGARAKYGIQSKDPVCRGKMLEGVCEAGETFFIPSGWWHLVINLEASIAVTQNFVGVHELPAVLRFLRDRSDQVSGLRGSDHGDLDLYEHLLAALDSETRQRGLVGLQQLDKATHKRKGKLWEDDNGASSFSFAFETEMPFEEDPSLWA